MTPYRRLLRLSYRRFFENDLASPDGGFETNIQQVLAIVSTPGMFVSFFLMPALFEAAVKPVDLRGLMALRLIRLFFPAFSFAAVGFAAFLQWNKLFPDRRDFLVLGPLPVPLKTFFAAKFSALCLFLLLLASAVNFFPTLLVPFFSLAVPEFHKAGYLRILASQVAATGGAAVFSFLLVAALQGVLINLTSPRIFRRISPWIQAAGMSAMIMVLLLFPVYSMLLPSAARQHAEWLWLLPPVWFTGTYDLVLSPSDPLFLELARVAGLALAAVTAIFCLSWGIGFQRHYRRTLESEDTDQRQPRLSALRRLAQSPFFAIVRGSPQEHAIFRFAGRTLARSSGHRLFLACYWSVGVSIGLLTTIVVRNGRVGVSEEGLRSFPLLIAFFVISGFRAAFQFPAELGSNWLFRLTEERWGETSRRATRKRVLASGLIPALLVFLPFEISKWGAETGLIHSAFQLAAGAVLIEILFWKFDKVPFTCSYYPGRIMLALLVIFYLFGFTAWGFRMADLETSLEGRLVRAVIVIAAASALVVLSWFRRPRPSEIMFDAADPEFQIIDLT
jgi:hypothetical protein